MHYYLRVVIEWFNQVGWDALAIGFGQKPADGSLEFSLQRVQQKKNYKDAREDNAVPTGSIHGM